MRKLSGVLLAACAMWQLGCAEPPMKGTSPAPKAAGGAQSGSTTGGGAEVPTPATTPATEAPKAETPAEPTPTPEAKPADPAPAEPTPEAAPEKKAE
ncbi:MAG: hypothetical protein Q8K78_16310 [Planctomycetaceae bacterium]|nr:hypothetical protein [Planctomycetaceae bacterium]